MCEVTVLMTVYNGMPYLRQAVDSILNQTYTDFRFVIVDDGSEDETAAFLDSLDDSRVTILRQDNQGTAKAANYGLTLVETPFVARMDADDVAMLDRLEKQVAFMQAHPEVGILGAQVAPAGEKGVGKSLNLPQTHEEIFAAMMEGRHGLAHSSLMIRTNVLLELGGYWSLPLIDDWDMMLRVGEVSKMANLGDVLLHYRVHSGSLNGQSMKRMYRHIGYAIERAKRRQSGQDQISYEDYMIQLNERSLPTRMAENLHIHAMAHYRVAVADIHGGRPVSGYLRLAYSAACSPGRTLHRLGRMIRPPKSNNVKSESPRKKKVPAGVA